MFHNSILIILLKIVILKQFSESTHENRNLNFTHHSDFNVTNYGTSQLNFFNFTEISPKLIAFMLEVYNVKNHRKGENLEIPSKSIEKIKKSDIVRHLTLKGIFLQFL